MKVKTALVSVSDKEGIVELAKRLQKLGIKIISTGGTAKLLQKNRIKVKLVSSFIRFPELLDGRVKTLHPRIHAAILANKKSKRHMQQLKKHNIDKIDMVVVNLYPFEKVILKKHKFNDAMENIDVGGPSMLRAAAKNFNSVAVVSDVKDYEKVLKELEKTKKLGIKTRARLANKAFMITSRYDTIISTYLNKYNKIRFPEFFSTTFEKLYDLRYGENPNQAAAFYRDFKINQTCVTNAKQLHGKQLSFNNILDTNDAFELIKQFKNPTAAVIKHTSPCGVASASTIEKAYKLAHEADPLSAFGSVVALNKPCNMAMAKMMRKLFIEVVIAPKFEKNALALLKQKKNIRLLETGAIKRGVSWKDIKKVTGGLLLQSSKHVEADKKMFKVVTKRKPTKREIKDMIFAWKVNKYVKSNSIVFAKNEITTGIGAGQMSRVDSSMIAARKAGKKAKGSVMSSDAFFPFRDGVDAAAKAGVTAIIQPGGSIRDKEVIKAANEHKMAMVFTGVRLFRH